jgi:peroxiredoxin
MRLMIPGFLRSRAPEAYPGGIGRILNCAVGLKNFSPYPGFYPVSNGSDFKPIFEQEKDQPMKIKQLLLANVMLINGLVLSGQTPDARGYIVRVGDPVPAVNLRLADGKELTMKDLKGKVVMLQFTASWCGVCRKEMPFIESDIWQVYKDKGLVLIGIDRGEPIEKVKAFAEQMKITYPLALDEDSGIFTRFADKSAGVTRNILIDRSGKIVFMTRLYDTAEFEALKKKIGSLL